MREITEKILLFTFSEAGDELRDKIRENFHSDPFHAEFMLEDKINTLKQFAKETCGDLDYSIGLVPDRGEFIRISYDCKRELGRFLRETKESCPLTGVCYDDDLIDNIRNHGLDDALYMFNQSIHDEYESMLSDDYLIDLCDANGYEFTIDGKLY